MKRFSNKWKGKTEYYNVYLYSDIINECLYMARYKTAVNHFDDIKEAAKWVDMKLIEDNKEPRNILKRKIN